MFSNNAIASSRWSRLYPRATTSQWSRPLAVWYDFDLPAAITTIRVRDSTVEAYRGVDGHSRWETSIERLRTKPMRLPRVSDSASESPQLTRSQFLVSPRPSQILSQGRVRLPAMTETTAPAGATAAYLRVSTEQQSLDQQHDALAAAGITPDRIFQDQLSGSAGTARPGLAEALGWLRSRDRLVVVALDRLGRSAAEVTATVADLTSRGITVVASAASAGPRRSCRAGSCSSRRSRRS